MKNKFIWLPVAFLAVAVIGAAVWFGSTATQKGALQFPYPTALRIPKMSVQLVNFRGEPVASTFVSMYSANEGLLKTWAITDLKGKATFDGISYDNFYFLGFGPGNNFGGLYTDTDGCNNITFRVKPDGKIYEYINMQDINKPVVGNSYVLYPTEYYPAQYAQYGGLSAERCPRPNGFIPLQQNSVPPPPPSTPAPGRAP